MNGQLQSVMSEAMAHIGRLEMVAKDKGAISAGGFWEWHFAVLWVSIDNWLPCLEVLWLGYWIYAGQATQPMGNGDINCGQSMQKWFLIVTGCRALGLH